MRGQSRIFFLVFFFFPFSTCFSVFSFFFFALRAPQFDFGSRNIFSVKFSLVITLTALAVSQTVCVACILYRVSCLWLFKFEMRHTYLCVWLLFEFIKSETKWYSNRLYLFRYMWYWYIFCLNLQICNFRIHLICFPFFRFLFFIFLFLLHLPGYRVLYREHYYLYVSFVLRSLFLSFNVIHGNGVASVLPSLRVFESRTFEEKRETASECSIFLSI